MKKTTEAMHAELGRAVCELRRRLAWSQEEMAAKIDKAIGPARRRSIAGWVSRGAADRTRMCPAHRLQVPEA